MLVDLDGFYRPLLELFDHLYEQRFAKPEYAELYHVTIDLDGLFAHVDDYEPADLPTKWY